MKNITTGADKLVQLISEKKRVSLDDAAKQLGVDKEVLREWAEFLEQEQHISIEYKLSKTWLIEKQISKKEVINVAKEFLSEKEAVQRKIDAIIQNLDSETAGFEKVKAEFKKIHEHIKSEIETVKQESKELERFEYLRKNVDKDIEQQKKEFESKLAEYRQAIDKETAKFSKIQETVDSQKKRVEELEKQMDGL
jgi:predicted ArsR family transcriptional regulator